MDYFQKRVFIIEDDAKLCNEFERLLTGSEIYNIVATVDGVSSSVLEQIRNNPPDVILLDLVLQKSSGMVFMQDLINNFDVLPCIIVITAIKNEQALNKLDRMGVDYRFDKDEFPKADKFAKEIVKHMEIIYDSLRKPVLKPILKIDNVVKFKCNK